MFILQFLGHRLNWRRHREEVDDIYKFDVLQLWKSLKICLNKMRLKKKRKTPDEVIWFVQ